MNGKMLVKGIGLVCTHKERRTMHGVVFRGSAMVVVVVRCGSSDANKKSLPKLLRHFERGVVQEERWFSNKNRIATAITKVRKNTMDVTSMYGYNLPRVW
jgi:hypothetical protein